MTEIKPCPFCGKPAYLEYVPHGIGANWAVTCTDTYAHRIEFSGTQDEVMKEWNKRATIPEPYPCSECEKVPTPKYTEGSGWSIGCCKTHFWWYDTREEAIRAWNRQWKNRKAREIKESYDSLVTAYREEMGLEDDE